MDGYLDEDGCPIRQRWGGVRDDIDWYPMTPEDDDGSKTMMAADPDNDGMASDPVDKCPNEQRTLTVIKTMVPDL